MARRTVDIYIDITDGTANHDLLKFIRSGLTTILPKYHMNFHRVDPGKLTAHQIDVYRQNGIRLPYLTFEVAPGDIKMILGNSEIQDILSNELPLAPVHEHRSGSGRRGGAEGVTASDKKKTNIRERLLAQVTRPVDEDPVPSDEAVKADIQAGVTAIREGKMPGKADVPKKKKKKRKGVRSADDPAESSSAPAPPASRRRNIMDIMNKQVKTGGTSTVPVR